MSLYGAQDIEQKSESALLGFLLHLGGDGMGIRRLRACAGRRRWSCNFQACVFMVWHICGHAWRVQRRSASPPAEVLQIDHILPTPKGDTPFLLRYSVMAAVGLRAGYPMAENTRKKAAGVSLCILTEYVLKYAPPPHAQAAASHRRGWGAVCSQLAPK